MLSKIFVNGEYYYDLFKSDTEVALYYSDTDMWNYRGELVIALQDDGNGFKIVQQNIGDRLDYDVAQELYILLSVIKDSKIEIATDTKEL